jgi:hypothetical protein
MSESVQAVLALLMIVSIIGSVFVFTSDRVNWTAGAGFLSLLVGSVGLLMWSLFRRDKAPDFLKKVPGKLLERDSLCFKVVSNPVKGRCYLDLHFQGRYDRPCRAVVVLQPSKGFFLTRPGLASMTVSIDCPAGGYGVTSVPWPVAKKYQGKVQSLDVGADVEYPEGRGKMIRYRGGAQLRTAGTDTFKAVMTVAAILTVSAGMGVAALLRNPVRVKLRLPVDVEESVDDDLPILTKVVWKVGHPVSQASPRKTVSTD